MKQLLLVACISCTGTISLIAVPITSILAITPLSFFSWSYVKVGLDNEISHISWSAKEDNNTLRFEIEHSIDSQSFTMVGITQAAGSNGEINTYNWLHSPAPGLNYYRIREVNKDGSATYSRIVCLPYAKGLSKSVAVPSSVVTDLTLLLAEPANQTILTVYNAEGVPIMNEKIVNGSTREVLDFMPYEKGVYFIRLQSKTKIEMLRITKNAPNLATSTVRSFDRD